MSQSESEATTSDGLGPSATQDEWTDLSNGEQEDILVGAMQERARGNAAPAGPAANTARETQAGAAAPGGFGSNAHGLRELMSEGWTARFKGVEVDMRTLDDETTKEVMDRAFDLFESAEESGAIEADEAGDVENPEDVAGAMDDDLIEMLMGGDEEFDSWLSELLADVTEDETMDESWWSDGTNYPGGAKIVLFVSLIERAANAYEAIENFR